MIIKVTYGKGSGPTKMSAFDAALLDAGIGDYNLIKLSSVIPVGSEIIAEKLKGNASEIGWKLYCVYSECIELHKGQTAYAGLGWATKEDGSGVFLEEHGNNERELRNRITGGIESMIKARKEKFSDISIKIEGILCNNKPVCAIVVAFYESEGWK